jgi:hypothetical protein
LCFLIQICNARISMYNVQLLLTKIKQGADNMKIELYTILDHNQGLLQQYRSITVMFQTLLIAIAICFLNYFSQQGNWSSYYASCYLFLILIGLYTTRVLFSTCATRSLYVDSVQDIIYALEAHKIEQRDDIPVMSILRYIQSDRHKDTRFPEINEIIDNARKSHISPGRGSTRFTMTWVFHGVFLWLGYYF